jgi:hypothetical protein
VPQREHAHQAHLAAGQEVAPDRLEHVSHALPHIGGGAQRREHLAAEPAVDLIEHGIGHLIFPAGEKL